MVEAKPPSTARGSDVVPSVLGAYAALVRSRLSAQMVYRGSFALEVTGQFGIGLVDFAEIYVVFHQVRSLGGSALPK